jgi:hypothetical protein
MQETGERWDERDNPSAILNFSRLKLEVSPNGTAWQCVNKRNKKREVVILMTVILRLQLDPEQVPVKVCRDGPKRRITFYEKAPDTAGNH